MLPVVLFLLHVAAGTALRSVAILVPGYDVLLLTPLSSLAEIQNDASPIKPISFYSIIQSSDKTFESSEKLQCCKNNFYS